jgi:beta-lactamase regulating signal transducer with metallopeptidase domain
LHVFKPVTLLESALVKVPTVIGWLKPVILIPPSALIGLTPQQFELILTHELAHIRRHDYLVNLLQTIIETLLFYHPAVWWVSLQIRCERENACDDLAVSLSSDPVIYARTLVEMERLRKAVSSLGNGCRRWFVDR